jgi:phenylacetate-coenzyme A ligase PaaK-like adenylate-forming protein
LAAAIALGTPLSVRSLERMVAAARAAVDEFGLVRAGTAELVGAAAMDQKTRRSIAERGFRKQAVRATKETQYYAALFDQIGCDPAELRFDDIAEVPVTSKEALREQPDAFVCRDAQPFLCAMTTGTTGNPARVSYSRRELDTFSCMAALHALVGGQIRPDDIVGISISLRAALAVTIAAGTCARVGATAYFTGQIEPAATLQLLSKTHRLPRKTSRTSVLLCYTSYLGELIEHGQALGYSHRDFGLRSIRVAGEIVTEGLLERARALFGPVEFVQGYATNELDPLSGSACSEGHLHFQPWAGLVEVQSLEGNGAARPGEPGTIVATPFSPYRVTTPLLRYDTQDVVRALPDGLSCSLGHLPAISKPLGRLPLSVQHDGGWTFQRDILEAVEGLDAVPLPTRFGFWRVPGGVAVELYTRSVERGVKDAVATALEEHGVPLRELELVDDPRRLRKPLPVRADLREISFELAEQHPAVVMAPA